MDSVLGGKWRVEWQYDLFVKTLICFLGMLVQVPPVETPRYPAGVKPPRAEAMGPQNLDFHEGSEDGVPAGWFVPQTLRAMGYGAELSKAGCKSEVCAVVTTPPGRVQQQPNAFGNLMQTFPAGAYRGKTIRLRAALRLEASKHSDAAQMWLRVDCAERQACSFDNMGDRPVRTDKWKNVEIKVRVPVDAVSINIGLISIGNGRAWIDEITMEALAK